MKEKAIIVDIDGTLANVNHRVHYVKSTPKEWKKFHSEASNDKVNSWCESIITAMKNNGYKIILVTGRDAPYKDMTISWLSKNNISHDLLYMRPDKDFREDSIIKKEIYEAKIKEFFDVEFVLEDRLQVVKMWRSLGLTCLQCDWGDF